MSAARAAAVACALVCGFLAIAWPHIFPSRSSDGRCPLGYGGCADGLPSPHGSGGGRPLPPGRLLLYTNAHVWAGDVAAAGAPTAEALLVDPATRRFVYVGSASGARAAAASREAEVEVTDLGGAHVIPGLVDAHLHLISGGLALSRLSLAAAASRREFVGAVAAGAAALGPGQWLQGGGWDENRWGGEAPSAAWIDAATGATPAWLLRHDAHMGLANSAALRLAGITAATADPPGGAILRGADGQPTGLLTDAAMQLVADRIPPLSVEERRRALEAAAAHALSQGITFVHDMGRIAYMEGEGAAWDDLEEVLAPAAAEGRLPLRVYAFVPLPTWRRLAERVRHLGWADPGGMLFWGGVKDFADGSLGSRTALFHAPYADAPAAAGARAIELPRLRQLVAEADAVGLQVGVHAIGDQAVDEVAAIYAELAAGRANSSPAAAGTQPGRQRRRPPHRVEHAQHISGRAAAGRLAAAGVAVTPNPLHLPADAGILLERLGPERAGAAHSYAIRTLLEAGMTCAFASDWPVVPLDPAGTLHAAVHRRAAGGSGPAWAPEEAVSVAQALAAHTAAGAAAAGLDTDLGRISAGMLADFVVLDAPPGTEGVAVRQTHVGGRCVYGCAAQEPGGGGGGGRSSDA